jgi:hypothetical protein
MEPCKIQQVSGLLVTGRGVNVELEKIICTILVLLFLRSTLG